MLHGNHWEVNSVNWIASVALATLKRAKLKMRRLTSKSFGENSLGGDVSGFFGIIQDGRDKLAAVWEF